MHSNFAKAQRAYDAQSAPDQPLASGKARVEISFDVEVEVDNGRVIHVLSIDDDDMVNGDVAFWLLRNFRRELVNGAQEAIEKGRAS